MNQAASAARRAPWALLWAALGCAPAAEASRDDASAAPPASATDGFSSLGEAPLSDRGSTALLEVPLGPGVGGLLVRASLTGEQGGPVDCFQIDEAYDSEGRSWVPAAGTSQDWGPYCTACSQRTSVGFGYGLFGFPNDGRPLAEARWLRLRVGLRSCAALLPADPAFDGALPRSMRVEVRRAPPPEGARGRLRLAFAFAQGGQFSAATSADDAVFSGALRDVVEVFGALGIDVEASRRADFAPGSGRLSWSDADRAPLDDLARQALDALFAGAPAERELPVVFAPCFSVQDPLHGTSSEPDGLTPRIPGGYPVGGHADAVLIKGAACGHGAAASYWSEAPLGKILRHEIGHYLGLYHSVEANGQTDHLDDTSEENAMFYAPLTAPARGFSAQQAVVLRSHPYVEFP